MAATSGGEPQNVPDLQVCYFFFYKLKYENWEEIIIETFFKSIIVTFL